MSGDRLLIYPRYLGQTEPGDAFTAGGDIEWVKALSAEVVKLAFVDCQSSVTYTPSVSGSYLATWSAGGEEFSIYFAVIKDNWIVLRFTTFLGLDPYPTLHATGIPLDYRLPAEQFVAGDALFESFLSYHRRFCHSIIPVLPDTPDITMDDRLARYGEALDRARATLSNPNELRSTRIEMHHEVDPSYTRALEQLGISDHCGLNAANARPWLGMPEFPYFSSPLDCREPRQTDGGDVFAHQWDFAGGWHFIGPVSWHYASARGSWGATYDCL